MKALTVRQPWAICIAAGFKLVENRTKRTQYRGPLAIHAAASWSQRGAEDDRVLALWGRPAERPPDPGCARRLDAADFASPTLFRHIIAVVDLVDCHPDHDCCRPWGESTYVDAAGRRRTDVWHLVLENVRPVWPPAGPLRGSLGFWLVPEETRLLIEERTHAG